MKLYKWQKECMQAWDKNHHTGIADVATGTGKTTLALALAEELMAEHSNIHIRIVVPTQKLSLQWKKDIIHYFHYENNPLSFVQIYDSKNKRSNSLFTIYVINTARTCINGHIVKDMKNGIYAFLIVDECHRAASPSNRNIFYFEKTEFFRPDLFACIGLSATPDRPDYPHILKNALGNIIYRYNTKEAEKDSIVNPFQIISTSIRLTGDELTQYGELTSSLRRLYSVLLTDNPLLKSLNDSAFFSALNKMASEDEESSAWRYLFLLRRRRTILYMAENRFHVIQSIIQHTRHQKCIIFSERIDQCESIYRQLNKLYPNKTGHYHSEMDADSKARNMNLFALGEYRILVTCRALDEGLNVPDASIGIIASSSSVQRQHIQRLGRILRRSDNKGISVLYYIYAENTVDNPIFLPDVSIIYQQYINPEQGFICTEYENAALHMKEEMKYESYEDQKTFEKAIEKASGTADWLYPDSYYDELIYSSSSLDEEDYWRIMKRLAIIHRHITAIAP